jgi:hypothetical protein
MGYKLPPLPDEVRPIIPMPIKVKPRSMDDVISELEELTANLSVEMDRIRGLLEQRRESQFEREMEEQYGD